jgi:hypothetical protein
MLCCFKKEYVHRYVLHLYEYVIKNIWTILKTIYVNYIYMQHMYGVHHISAGPTGQPSLKAAPAVCCLQRAMT